MIDRMPLPVASYRIIFSLISFGPLYGVSVATICTHAASGAVFYSSSRRDIESMAVQMLAIEILRETPSFTLASLKFDHKGNSDRMCRFVEENFHKILV